MSTPPPMAIQHPRQPMNPMVGDPDHQLRMHQQQQMLQRHRQQQFIQQRFAQDPALAMQQQPRMPQQHPSLPSQVISQQAWMANMLPPHARPTPSPTMDKAFKLMPTGHLTGQGVLRLIQLGDRLAPGDRALQRSFWDGLVHDFFAPEAKLNFGVCNANTNEKQQFEICQSLVARFFLTQYECQVTSIQFHTDQTLEYFLAQGMMVKCPTSSFIYRYTNSSMVVMTGETSMILRLDPNEDCLKIQEWTFSCEKVEEFISRTSLTDFVPPSPKRKKQPAPGSVGKQAPISLVNEWGLPERVYALLKMIDAMSKRGEVGFYSLCQQYPQILPSLLSASDTPITTSDVQSSDMPTSEPTPAPSSTSPETKTNKKDTKKPRQNKRKASTSAGAARKNSKAQPPVSTPLPPAPHPEMPIVTAPMVASPQQQALMHHQLQQQKIFQLQQMQQLPSSPYPQQNIQFNDNMIQAYPSANGSMPADKTYLTTPPSPR
ncbi:hypothetical protein DM01DRAFT_1334090 [Hesseltinella vesiculosa]|uniref:LIM-domain binding protein n=1 Tax=Hesseltinella vesiculosa TaxID=101127 RepID=A0A1X2GN36_9FUNG|nr:hypothetical protein DM01DRAFT_1334090 [Hesseltinella vesiculosa]